MFCSKPKPQITDPETIGLAQKETGGSKDTTKIDGNNIDGVGFRHLATIVRDSQKMSAIPSLPVRGS